MFTILNISHFKGRSEVAIQDPQHSKMYAAYPIGIT